MTRQPTGRIIPTPGGRDLVLQRTFRAPIEDVWASITEPERSARWIASWTGESGPGKTITIQMTAEEGAEPEPAAITACDAPRHLAMDWVSGGARWRTEVSLKENDGITTLTFVHHLTLDDDVSDIGPGWEYYLDRLVADRAGEPFASWEEYYPVQKDHYAETVR